MPIAPFILVGREALEIMFITLMITTFIKLNWSLYASAIVGIVAGFILGWQLGNLLAPYEWLMYGFLSAMMIYLYFTSHTMGQNIVNSVEKMGSGTSIAALVTIFVIFARESSEIFMFMFMASNNTIAGWMSASVAIALVVGMFPIIKNKVSAQVLFNVTRYAFLIFGLWFGYEALMHWHIFEHGHVL